MSSRSIIPVYCRVPRPIATEVNTQYKQRKPHVRVGKKLQSLNDSNSTVIFSSLTTHLSLKTVSFAVIFYATTIHIRSGQHYSTKYE